jgi:hypothetical protein
MTALSPFNWDPLIGPNKADYEIAATALAQYLSNQEHGMEKIRDMIVDDIRQAQQRLDKAHVLTLLHALHHFLKSHPEVCPAQHPWSKLY